MRNNLIAFGSVSIAGFLATAFLGASAAGAEEMEVPASEGYLHEYSGVVLEPEVAGFKRYRINRYRSDNDVSATYDDEASGTFLTVYLTRVGTADPYLWFHRVLGVITQQEGFEPFMAPGVQPEFFTAPGFARPSGVRVSYATRGSDLRSSGVAMMVYGDILIKVRASSEEFDRTQVDRVIDDFIGQLDLPEPKGNEPVAYLVEPCIEKLSYSDDAVQSEPTGAQAIATAMMALNEIVLDEEQEPIPNKVQYCFDGKSADGMSIYRPDNSTTGYLISYDDTGRALIVGGGGASLLSALGSKKNKGSYPIFHQLPDETEIYASYDKLPSPEIVTRLPGTAKIIASTDRAKDISITAGLN